MFICIEACRLHQSKFWSISHFYANSYSRVVFCYYKLNQTLTKYYYVIFVCFITANAVFGANSCYTRVLSVWGEIMIAMDMLWLHGLLWLWCPKKAVELNHSRTCYVWSWQDRQFLHYTLHYAEYYVLDGQFAVGWGIPNNTMWYNDPCGIWDLGQLWFRLWLGSGDALLPDTTRPLPEPMVTRIYVAIWHVGRWWWYFLGFIF